MRIAHQINLALSYSFLFEVFFPFYPTAEVEVEVDCEMTEEDEENDRRG